MRAVLIKELHSYSRNLRTYLFIAVFLFISGIYFSKSIMEPEYTSFADALKDISVFMILLSPILTMHSLALERLYKTDRILLTGYAGIFSIIMGKFFAAFCIFFVTSTLAFLYPAVIALAYSQTIFEVLLLYIGFLLFGMATLSFGIFISSLSRHPARAAIVSVAGMLVFWMIGNALPNIQNSALQAILLAASLFTHLEGFSYGLLNFSSVTYMLSFSIIFLMLSAKIVSLWNRGKT